MLYLCLFRCHQKFTSYRRTWLLFFPPHGAKPQLVRFDGRNTTKVSSAQYKYPGAAWMVTILWLFEYRHTSTHEYHHCICHIHHRTYSNDLLSKCLMYIRCPRNRSCSFPVPNYAFPYSNGSIASSFLPSFVYDTHRIHLHTLDTPEYNPDAGLLI